MFYELATLTLRVGTTATALAAAEKSFAGGDQTGTLLGCWFSDIGSLNRIAILRGFADLSALHHERERCLLSSNPFGCAELANRIELNSYAPFPGLPAVEPGKFGPVYEIRSYELKTAGLQPTLNAWRDALPARHAISPCLIAMYALDGAPRITHIWPAASLQARGEARAAAVKSGGWPPKDGPNWLTPDMNATVYLPAAFSPLQ